MRLFLLPLMVFGIVLTITSTLIEYSDPFDTDSINLWATVLSYPEDVPSSKDFDPYYEIALMNPTTGQTWLIANGYGLFGLEGSYYRPKWSADGQWLYAEVASHEPSSPIFRAYWTGDRMETVQASDNDHILRSVDSPDQQWTVWTTVDAGWDRYALYISSVNGSRLRELVHNVPLHFNGYQPVVLWGWDSDSVFVAGNVLSQADVFDENSVEIWKIQVPNGDVEKILELSSGEWLQAANVADEWLLYAHSGRGGVTLHTMRMDGRGDGTVAVIPDALHISDIWQPTDQDLLIVFYDRNSDDHMLHIDVESGEIDELMEIEDGQFGQLWSGPSFSNNGRYMAVTATTEDEEIHLFLSSTDGDNVVRLRVAPCHNGRASGMWRGNDYYFFDESSAGLCQLKQLRAEESIPTVAHTLPKNAKWMSFIRTEARQWLQYWMDETMYVANLDGSMVFPTEFRVEQENLAWTELPLREADNRLLILAGLFCITLSLTPTLKILTQL